jgi:hypothetical protein
MFREETQEFIILKFLKSKFWVPEDSFVERVSCGILSEDLTQQFGFTKTQTGI